MKRLEQDADLGDVTTEFLDKHLGPDKAVNVIISAKPGSYCYLDRNEVRMQVTERAAGGPVAAKRILRHIYSITLNGGTKDQALAERARIYKIIAERKSSFDMGGQRPETALPPQGAPEADKIPPARCKAEWKAPAWLQTSSTSSVSSNVPAKSSKDDDCFDFPSLFADRLLHRTSTRSESSGNDSALLINVIMNLMKVPPGGPAIGANEERLPDAVATSKRTGSRKSAASTVRGPAAAKLQACSCGWRHRHKVACWSNVKHVMKIKEKWHQNQAISLSFRNAKLQQDLLAKGSGNRHRSKESKVSGCPEVSATADEAV